jgi:2,5-diketo-D-gluconate reductase A
MNQPTVTLNDGHEMPQLGFGVFKVPQDEAASIVGQAIATGYRSIDTAAIYRNEEGVGGAIAAASVPREELFITTKLWNDAHAALAAHKALETSLEKLGLKAIDLYLIHWPTPGKDDYVEAWKALIAARDAGLVRSIGVSNFTIKHLKRIMDETGIVPSVNQVELHPSFQQNALRAFHAEHGIATESWSPLGQGAGIKDPTIGAIARKHGRTPAQVILRWHLDLGLVVIPKSGTPERIAENFAVFDFALDKQDWATFETLDRADGRLGPDPDSFN